MLTATATAFHVESFRAADYLRLADDVRDEIGHPICADPAAVAREYARTPGAAYTGFLGDRPIGAAGIVMVWPGLGRAWALLNAEGRRHPSFVHRAVLRGARTIIRRQHIRRLEADVLEDFAAGRRWAEALGFTAEGRMPHYGPRGETFIRYALFPSGAP